MGIRDCWIENIVAVKSGIMMVGEVFTAQLTLVREVDKPKSLYHVVDECPPGQVMVVSDIHDTFLIGENVLTRASNKGLAGVVVEAKNRDIEGIRALPMPVFSQGVGVKVLPATLKVHCETQVPIDLGGAKIYPGDVIVGDSDGLVIIPGKRLEDVVYQVEMVAEVEREVGNANKEKPDMPVEDFLKIIAKKKIPRT